MLRVDSPWTASTLLSRTALGCYQATTRKLRPYPPYLLQLIAELPELVSGSGIRVPAGRKGDTVPIHPSLKDLYPSNWTEISQNIRFERARGHCEWCGAVHGQPHPETGSRVILATAHLDHNPANNAADNLAALCQKCHNTYDAGKRHANRKHRALAAAGQLPLFGPNHKR